ncbi:MAG: hypothetical protein ACJ8KX_05845 [Chthoniobacterales bacterium]
MSSGLMLTGRLPLVLLGAAFIALPLSFFLLQLYKRAVLRSMSKRAATQPGNAESERPTRSRNTALSPNELRRIALRSPWRAALIYVTAGCAYAIVVACAELIAGKLPFSLLIVLVLVWNYAWAIAWSVILIAGAERRTKAIIVLAYFAVLFCGAFVGMSAKQIVVLWGFSNLGPTLLLLCFLTRPIRAVGPVIFTFVLVAAIGCEIAFELLAYDVQHSGTVTHAALSLGFNATTYLALVLGAGFLIFAVFGWFAMRWIGRRYERKKITDQSIMLDAIWITFASVHAVFLSINGAAWALAAILALAIYKLTLAIAFRCWRIRTSDAPRLLILRVFSLGRRSQRMFHRVAQHWRYVGSIQFIAGPDLATTTVDPHEFLAFLGGKLARRFIDGARAFEKRLAEADLTRDFDQRFRVNDFFCQENAWQLVLSRLVRQSDAVLIDLRGFTSANAGCVFELQELKKLARPGGVVLIVDDTTSEEFLNETLGDSAVQFRFVKTAGRGGEVHHIIETICAAAAAA